MVQERIKPDSIMMADEHAAYKSLKELEYDYHHDAGWNMFVYESLEITFDPHNILFRDLSKILLA